MTSIFQTDQISPSVYTDNSSLDRIRQKAKTDSPAAIKAAAKEFEAFFMNMMLKSMRQASEVIGEESMFSSPQEKMFVGMLDEQMSVELSQKGSLGIAELMTRNLLPAQTAGFQRSDSRLKQTSPVEGKVEHVNIGLNELPLQNKFVENRIKKGIEQEINKNSLRVNEKNFEVDDAAKKDKIINVSSVETMIPAKPIKRQMFDSIASFVEQLMPLAQKAASRIGLDPKILLAQAALETGWGKHVIHDSEGSSSFNLFGIKDSKSWKGDSVKIDTLEVESGEFVKRKADFRSYTSFENSFNDFITFISENPRYEKAMNFVHDAKQFVRSMHDAGYATDPQYANKIINIFNRNLTK